MKHFYVILPGALLLSYAVYTTFVPITIAHSIILLSLAGLFGYSMFINSQQSPSLKQELKNSHEQLELKLKQQEEFYAERLKRVEDLAGGLALANNRAGSVPPTAKVNSDKKMIF